MDTPENARPTALTHRPQWKALQAHAGQIAGTHLRELFAADPALGPRPSAAGAGLYLDSSQQRVDADPLRLLPELAEACGLPARTAATLAAHRTNRRAEPDVLPRALGWPR